MSALRFLLFCGILTIGSFLNAQQDWPYDPRRGYNILVGEDPALLDPNWPHQAEPHIVRSPLDPEMLLAVWQDGRYSDGGANAIGYAVSDDGGYSWNRNVLPNLTSTGGGPYNRATDPVAGIGPDGRFYVNALVSTQGVFDEGAIVLLWSDDNGESWSEPNVIFQSEDPFPDKNWMVINPHTGSSTEGRIVVTWSNFHGNGRIHIALTWSEDGGRSWTTPKEITRHQNYVQGSQPMFLPDGSLGIAYHVFNSTNTSGRIEFLYSEDGGQTLDPPRFVNNYVLYDDSILRHGPFLISASADAKQGNLFLAYGESTGGIGRIMFTRSSDRGVSWMARQQVSDNEGSQPAVSPTLAVSPDGEHLIITYYQKPDVVGLERYFAEVRMVQSFDGGQTWGESILLSDGTMDVSKGAIVSGNRFMLGDYFGLAPSGGLRSGVSAVALWIGTFGQSADPYSVRVTPWPDKRYWAWDEVSFGPLGERRLDWFGRFWEANFPWHYHETHGWLYSESSSTRDIVFYDVELGYWWTSRAYYPWLYSYAQGEWLYYQPESTKPRWFYRRTSEEWFSLGG